MKAALNQFMQGAAASPACASIPPFDRTDTWTIVDKQDFAIQIESQQNGARRSIHELGLGQQLQPDRPLVGQQV
ncbi:hypothetical protein ABIA48_004919 [Pseudomonas sp. S30_BP2TU TE3576]|jgi:hypothetical protein